MTSFARPVGRGRSRGRGGESSQSIMRPRFMQKPQNSGMKRRYEDTRPSVVVILEKAGLWLGREGLVDAYERTATTEVANESLTEARPDIVHQCLLALFDSDLGAAGRLRIYISTTRGCAIEVSPNMRPPRTFHRFKGLVETLLRDGRVVSADGETLLSVMQGTVSPAIPFGAPVVGLSCSKDVDVVSPTELAQKAIESPVPDTLQGGVKNVYAFYCVSCTDDASIAGIDYVTNSVCLSQYPLGPHVMCFRLCEGFSRVESRQKASARGPK